MRFAERFLVVFALISLVMRVWGLKDGPTLELIALPALALFYIIAMPFIARQLARSNTTGQGWGIGYGIFSGLAFAYCIISLMLYTLGWAGIGRADMLVNSSLILGLMILVGIFGWRMGKPVYAQIGLRAAILLGGILIIAALPMAPVGSLSRGAF